MYSRGGARSHSHISATRAEYGCQSDLTTGLPKLPFNIPVWRVKSSVSLPFCTLRAEHCGSRILEHQLSAQRLPLSLYGANPFKTEAVGRRVGAESRTDGRDGIAKGWRTFPCRENRFDIKSITQSSHNPSVLNEMPFFWDRAP